VLLLVWIRQRRSQGHLGNRIPNVMIQEGEFLRVPDQSSATLFNDDEKQEADYDHLPDTPYTG